MLLEGMFFFDFCSDTHIHTYGYISTYIYTLIMITRRGKLQEDTCHVLTILAKWLEGILCELYVPSQNKRCISQKRSMLSTFSNFFFFVVFLLYANTSYFAPLLYRPLISNEFSFFYK